MLRDLSSLLRHLVLVMGSWLSPAWWLADRGRNPLTFDSRLVPVVLFGLLASIALPSFVGAQDKARNAALRANVLAVRAGVERYAKLHGGAYPAPRRWVTDVQQVLPEHQLPPVSWCHCTQSEALTLEAGDLGLPGAHALHNGAQPIVPGLKLGGGHVAVASTFDTRTYGAIIYDVDPAAHAFVLYGIGKRNREAVVVAASFIDHDLGRPRTW